MHLCLDSKNVYKSKAWYLKSVIYVDIPCQYESKFWVHGEIKVCKLDMTVFQKFMKNNEKHEKIHHSITQSFLPQKGRTCMILDPTKNLFTAGRMSNICSTSFLLSSCVAQHQYFSPNSTKRGSPQPQLKYVRIIWHWIYIFLVFKVQNCWYASSHTWRCSIQTRSN